jgi:hypothetical protein
MPPKNNKNNSTIVKNINGTSKSRYVVPNLKQKFSDNGGTSSSTCQVKACKNPASATAHIINTDGRVDNTWKTTQLCSSHNNHNNKSEMALRKNAKLIPINKINKL